jgi:hypothetical protein
MTSSYLNLPCSRSSARLKAGVKTLLTTLPSAMPEYAHQAPPREHYRELARRLRELARKTHRPYVRQELLRLSGIYERRGGYLESQMYRTSVPGG